MQQPWSLENVNLATDLFSIIALCTTKTKMGYNMEAVRAYMLKSDLSCLSWGTSEAC